MSHSVCYSSISGKLTNLLFLSCGSSSLFPQKFSQTVISFAFFCLPVLSFIQVPLIFWRKKVAKKKGKGSWKINLTHIHLVDAFFFIQERATVELGNLKKEDERQIHQNHHDHYHDYHSHLVGYHRDGQHDQHKHDQNNHDHLRKMIIQMIIIKMYLSTSLTPLLVLTTG